ncbi:hypothetical protein GCM10009802_45380 [Streptomyces synnematoformans]|uniref:RNA polymerase sigma-70 factor n=1 Tax=Streptomyces synnematoformans TaxID=415721 RepID=A0ABN2Z491_9ACTN
MSQHGEHAAETPARGDRVDPATAAFVSHRNLLFTVAYEMLGSAADSEDVLQETWLQWADVDLDTVRDQRAFLVRITTRRALDRLRTLARRKESYVGPWLPEPLLTAPDVAEDVELADSVSMAMLLVLETLGPTERAVFVLREVFELPYDEIAEAVDKSEGAIRQIAHRARAHVAARRPRTVVSAAETQDALEAFQRALESGDLQGLLDKLAPDVVYLGDSGGAVPTAGAPVVGAVQVASLLTTSRLGQLAAVKPAQVNGHPALLLQLRGDQRRPGRAHRRGPHHRALRGTQPREALAHGTCDRLEPLSRRAPGAHRRVYPVGRLGAEREPSPPGPALCVQEAEEATSGGSSPLVEARYRCIDAKRHAGAPSGGCSSRRGLYSTIWVRPSKVRWSVMSRATSG